MDTEKLPVSVGFTGSRHGMTELQQQAVEQLLVQLNPTEAHHGDCVGSDAEFHALVARLLPDTRLVIHPPNKNQWRAFCQGQEEKPAADFLARNHHIVDAATIVIGAPQESIEKQRSGTWATIRYTLKSGKNLYVVTPDGAVTEHSAG